jgi:transcriptional regulator with GAF, ATPase, and Fis domain
MNYPKLAALIRHVLIGSEWNTAEAARRLGLKPTTLHYKLRQHGFCRPDKRHGL